LKKLPVFLIIFLLVLASTTYLYYNHWRSVQQAEEALPYIPQSAALVYEVADFGKQWEHFRQMPMAKTLNQVPAFVAIQHGLSFLRNLVGTPKNLDKVPLTVSVHGLGEEHLGYIFYFNMHDAATQGILGAIALKIEKEKAYSKTIRKCAGYKITELSKHGVTQPLSYTKHEQYIIVSYSSLLIEDVVRGLASKQKTGFLDLKKGANTQGSLYVNFSQLPQLLRTFVQHGQVDTFSDSLTTFALASHFNLKLTHHHLLFSGFAREQETTSPSYLTHTLPSQAADAMLLAPYLPQNTAVLQHFTFSDAEQLLASFQQYRSSPKVGETSKSNAINLLSGTLDPLLQGEIGHCTLATGHNQQKEQLVFIKVRDPQAFIEALQGSNLLTLLSSQELNLPVSTHKLTTDYFQNWLPGQLFPAFKASYITQVNDYIVLANSQIGLQTWHSQYRQGKTWSNTPQQNVWLESTLDKAHFSLFVDLKKAWPQIIHSLKPAWQQVCKTHAGAFQKFRHVSLQLLHEPDTGCYISILLNHQEETKPTRESATQQATTQQDTLQKTLTTSTIFQTEAPMINRPWLVKSHRGKGHYILLQDALHQLYFLDPTGKMLWKKPLEGPITTDFFEVDYYKNNKTQYLFATDKQLHLLDYLGHKINKYPHLLHQPGQPAGLRVVDYRNNKQYRFLIATAQGNIYLKDKHYRPLPAWNPRSLGQGFASTPLHLRVQGNDYFLVLQTNGTLHALNRKGQNYPGFPVDLKAPVHHPLLVRTGETVNDTSLIVLTDTGQHICLNLTGCIQEAVQLDCSENASSFTLCPNSVTGHQYVMMRQDADKITVMDKTGSLLFEAQHQAQHLLLQYYNFDDTHQYYVLINLDAQLTYLYDHTGRLLHDVPWHNKHKVSLFLSKAARQLEIYVGFETTLSKYTLPY
jgi:hypothetical protein